MWVKYFFKILNKYQVILKLFYEFFIISLIMRAWCLWQERVSLNRYANKKWYEGFQMKLQENEIKYDLLSHFTDWVVALRDLLKWASLVRIFRWLFLLTYNQSVDSYNSNGIYKKPYRCWVSVKMITQLFCLCFKMSTRIFFISVYSGPVASLKIID